MENFGNKLHGIVAEAKNLIFRQGEIAELSFGALNMAAESARNSEKDEIEIHFPVGVKPDKSVIESRKTYKKDELAGMYQYLASNELAINLLIKITTLVEAMFGDLIRAVLLQYPQKLGSKKSISLKHVFESTSIEEIHIKAADIFINELTYKSPADFSASVQPLISINLLECSAFHKYMEIEATRDIHIHNRGVANEIYERKAGTHLRAKANVHLPVNMHYFLDSYETCIQMTEWIEKELHNIWFSTDYEDRQNPQKEMNLESKNESQSTDSK